MQAKQQALSDDDLRLILDIAESRANTMDALKAALEAGDDLRALEVARELVRLEKRTGA
jgi:hypothetical protein